MAKKTETKAQAGPARKKPASRPKRTRAQLKELAFSALILLGALICFGIFARNSLLGGATGNSTSEGAIATLGAGRVEQKRFGRSTFLGLGPNSRLYNRDAVWVGPGGSATLIFDDGTGLELQENTFIVLKRGMVRLGEDSGVQLLKGKVDVKVPSHLFGRSHFKVEMRDRTVVADGTSASGQNGAQLIQTDVNGNALESGDKGALPSDAKPSPLANTPPGVTPREDEPTEPLPPNVPLPTSSTKGASPRPSPAPLGPEAKVNPKPGALILLIKEKVAQVSFSWPNGLYGNLVVTDDQGTPFKRLPVVAKTRFAKLPLPIGKTYRWRLMDEKSTLTLLGPFEVTVLPFDAKTMDQVIKNDPRRTIEVVE